MARASSASSAVHPDVVPSRTSDSITHLPTVFANARLLQPHINEVSGCCANKVIINLSTTLVIPDYSLYYSDPIDSFQPSFYASNDGSLVAPPFIEDLSSANISLLVTGMLAMLFVRNIIVSGDYLRRGKVKRKVLFYVLFFSQMLAPISFAPVIMSYFTQRLDCSIVIVLSCLSATVSLALLITGILGVKAYKCLNNSRFVLIMLALFQCASSGTIAMDVATMQGERRLTGSCVRVSGLLCTRIFVSIQFVESLFICLCFTYACWKSRGSSSARGRISIQLSMEELPIEVPVDNNETHPTLRGWWDYVPNTQTAPPLQPPSNIKPDRKFSLRSKLIGSSKNKYSRTHPTVVGSDHPGPEPTPRVAGRATSPTPSSLSRLGKLVPNMELFRKVMKDELLYTTFITATCVVVAVLAVIGVNFKNGLTVTGWIALNWSIISLLAIHSFGRVVHRHERDVLLQHPALCNAIVRAGNAIAEKKQPESRISVNPQLRYRREAEGNDKDDPFSDTRRLGDSRRSWDSGFSTPPSPPSSSLPAEEYSRVVPMIARSPPVSVHSGSFPTSGRNTPLVPHQSSDDALVQGFSQSWLLDRVSLSVEEDQKNSSIEDVAR
ncbi:hypothetical protein Hypma_015374 [Hypsizygus marmoreus]|uniref:Uncharacterized protein n=1 Tax=Hypsizygus marmoreus TaxID=39966 RepID=A0A369KD15_HYPMA|nr:hypothetical protein Hypma_015374 [Hypsizygus marmoreus]